MLLQRPVDLRLLDLLFRLGLLVADGVLQIGFLASDTLDLSRVLLVVLALVLHAISLGVVHCCLHLPKLTCTGAPAEGRSPPRIRFQARVALS
jgi:hypothetical protein